jgi:hypothetical protein
MKLSTLALIAATVAIPAAAFADSSQPKSAPGAEAADSDEAARV